MFGKKKRYRTPNQKATFEKAFLAKIGQTPADFVFAKLSVGSDPKAVQYLYDITAAEVCRYNKCTPVPFSVLNCEATKQLQENKQKMQERESRSSSQHLNRIAICKREFLNRTGTQPFGSAHATDLDLLYDDPTFRDKISQIAKENSQIEFCNNSHSPEFLNFKRVVLPARMNALGLTEHPIVQAICESVERNGHSRKSALITIYYAIRMYQLKSN